MKVISIFNMKGGCGKSTLTVQLAGGLAAKNSRVAVVDLDEQQSCFTFYKHALNCKFEVFSGFPEKKPEGFDFLLVDHSPERSEENYPENCDLVIMPVVPSAFDAWSTAPTLAALEKRKLKTLVVINKFQAGRQLQNEFVENFEADFKIYERSIYARTIANYSTVHDPRGISKMAYGLGGAKSEIDLLIKKIHEALKI